MLDRTIPYYNVIMRCDACIAREIKLPLGYSFSQYRDEFALDWAELEYAVGDFASVAEAKEYFDRDLSPTLTAEPHRGVFIVDQFGKAVASCLSWEHPRNGQRVASLHWAVTSPDHQGKGLGRAACTRALELHAEKGELPVYLHTQPWSWRGILLYISLGFKLMSTDTFSTHVNQYSLAMEALKPVLTEEQYNTLVINSI